MRKGDGPSNEENFSRNLSGPDEEIIKIINAVTNFSTQGFAFGLSLRQGLRPKNSIN